MNFVQGAHASNSASGEFNVVATPGWKIKNGGIVHAVKNAMLAGDSFQVLANVSALVDNERKSGSSRRRGFWWKTLKS